MLKLSQALADIRSSLWFIPTCLMLLAIALAAAAIDLDSRLDLEPVQYSARLFGASAEAARGLLQVIAGGMISTATLSFSITVLVLSNAAAQYTPAVIRTFMASRPTQLVLGTFIGIFVYCLLVLRSVRAGPDEFVPSISIVVAIGLAIVGVGVLVYFVHHVASSIQAPHVVSSIARATVASIRDHHPEPVVDAPPDAVRSQSAKLRDKGYPIPAQSTGYLRSVDREGLAKWADKHQLQLSIDRPIGAFFCCGTPLAWMSRKPDERMLKEFAQHYTLGHFRTVEQDPAVGIEQLLDIALKSMSASTRDLSTAKLCMDYLAELLIVLSGRQLCPTDTRHRLDMPVPDFADFLDMAVTPLRDHAGDDPAIHLALVSMLCTIADNVRSPSRKLLVLSHLQHVANLAQQHLPMQTHRDRVAAQVSAAFTGRAGDG